MNIDIRRAVLAEAVGTATLVMAVVGSGIMAQRLTDDVAIQLLVNAAATVGALGVLMATLLPVSGAHLNPVVSGVMFVKGQLSGRQAAAYVGAQVIGGVGGTLIAHAMYEQAVVSTSSAERGGAGAWLGEVIATAGLILAILLVDRAALPLAVPAWIGAAYFFTSSTSFANPAVTIARGLTDSFSGIAPGDIVGFVLAQMLGGFLAVVLLPVLKESS